MSRAAPTWVMTASSRSCCEKTICCSSSTLLISPCAQFVVVLHDARTDFFEVQGAAVLLDGKARGRAKSTYALHRELRLAGDAEGASGQAARRRPRRVPRTEQGSARRPVAPLQRIGATCSALGSSDPRRNGLLGRCEDAVEHLGGLLHGWLTAVVTDHAATASSLRQGGDGVRARTRSG